MKYGIKKIQELAIFFHIVIILFITIVQFFTFRSLSFFILFFLSQCLFFPTAFIVFLPIDLVNAFSDSAFFSLSSTLFLLALIPIYYWLLLFIPHWYTTYTSKKWIAVFFLGWFILNVIGSIYAFMRPW